MTNRQVLSIMEISWFPNCNRQVRKMAELLEKTNSSYYPSFKSLFHDVVQALTEAQDINLYLKPLMTHFEDFEQVTNFISYHNSS